MGTKENKSLLYGDTYDLYGAKSPFRQITSKLVGNIVNTGNWFSFCAKIHESQVDIMSIENKDKLSMGHIIYELCIYQESSYRTSIYKYLMQNYLCYYECPTVIRGGDFGIKNSYEKLLVTSNLHVIASWLGITVEDAKSLYGSRIDDASSDNGCDLFPYVKLYMAKDGTRKVSKPRSDLDLGKKGTRVIPLYALEVGVSLLYDKLKSDVYNVSFYKDGGQLRTISTTFNVDRLIDIYGDGDYIRSAFESWYSGDFTENSSLGRGYIRVFEVGASVYDNPLRSINYARIVKIENGTPDLAFINVDLSSVVSKFKDGIYSNNANIKEVVEMLNVFDVGSERKLNGRDLVSLQDLESWVDGQELLLSTVFLRQLSLFMTGNPQWFGETKGTVQSYKNDVANEDFEDIFELEMG